ncbi:hypothetical protein QQ008_01750 [Fulvivirgaceae bacterium BMA10]|uniref:Polyamine aminopropyltransferase n=1 Tax=Splendidivirga corallicola TaxID=3051826 RepID=A0ABT8KKE6_9BACT|nr:hypothetical protein [Fulvivirgaceae bacterium BMA10]
MFKLKPGYLYIASFIYGLATCAFFLTTSKLTIYFLKNASIQKTVIGFCMVISIFLGYLIARQLKESIKRGDRLNFYLKLSMIPLLTLTPLFIYWIVPYTFYLSSIVYVLASVFGLIQGTLLGLLFERKTLVRNTSFFFILGIAMAAWLFSFLSINRFVDLVAIIACVEVFFMIMASGCKKIDVSSNLLIVIGISLVGRFYFEPIVFYDRQSLYDEKVILSEPTNHYWVTLTQWYNDHWMYLNNNLQLSTIDDWLYYEPMVHPAMHLAKEPKNILILGGETGCALREVLKYDFVESVTLIEIDSELRRLASDNLILQEMNQRSFQDGRVNVISRDPIGFLEKDSSVYDVVIIDAPDPANIQMNVFYSLELYQLILARLNDSGVLVTQAGSPYFATKAFRVIEKTMAAAGFSTEAMHNQVLSLGEWGWIIGSPSLNEEQLEIQLKRLHFDKIETKWINNESMQLLTSFGKDLIPVDSISVNSLSDPILHHLYVKGNWPD